MVEMTIAPHAEIDQEIPSSYNGFVFVIRGSVRIGEDSALLNAGQVAWLDRPQGDAVSTLRAVAGAEGARLVLYSGQPQGDNIVSHGPFIGDSQDDIRRLYAEYRAGRFQRMSELARAKRPA
jgi:redox-sensitive bicupin YhaK (pirin superfamily)